MTFLGCISVLLLCVELVNSNVDEEENVTGPPQNLTIVRIHDRSVDLKWSQPTEPNGEIRGYRVYYMRGNFTSVKTTYANDNQITYTLHDLDPDSQFKVWTRAFTQRHEGKSSQPVFVETDLSEPSAPIISNLTCQTDATLLLQWLRPGKVYGQVDLYYIYFRPEDSYEFDEIVVNSVNNRMEHNFLLTNLSRETLYVVKVRGGTYSRFFNENNHTYKGPFSQSAVDCAAIPVTKESSGSVTGGSSSQHVLLDHRNINFSLLPPTWSLCTALLIIWF